VIHLMDEQKDVRNLGGTMRLGAYDCEIDASSPLRHYYGADHIRERHRHRYEFNDAYLSAFRDAGMIPVGKNPQSGLVEIIALNDHPYFVGTQFHPEYKSTVEHPHPLFVAFVEAAKAQKELRKEPMSFDKHVPQN